MVGTPAVEVGCLKDVLIFKEQFSKLSDALMLACSGRRYPAGFLEDRVEGQSQGHSVPYQAPSPSASANNFSTDRGSPERAALLPKVVRARDKRKGCCSTVHFESVGVHFCRV